MSVRSKYENLSPQKKKQYTILTPFLLIAVFVLITGLAGNSVQPSSPSNPADDQVEVIGDKTEFGNITDNSSVKLEIPQGENTTSVRSDRFQVENAEELVVDADRFNEDNNASITVYVTKLYYGSTNSTSYELVEGENTYSVPEIREEPESPLAFYVDFNLMRENPETASPRVLDFGFQ